MVEGTIIENHQQHPGEGITAKLNHEGSTNYTGASQIPKKRPREIPVPSLLTEGEDPVLSCVKRGWQGGPLRTAVGTGGTGACKGHGVMCGVHSTAAGF